MAGLVANKEKEHHGSIKNRRYHKFSILRYHSHRQPVSSLIVYQDSFGLGQGCFGIGSLATTPAMRGQGFGAHLLCAVTNMLLSDPNTVATFLHADIDHHFYERRGYRRIQSGDCIHFSLGLSHYISEPPTYF
jgi:GNAT superfamily N-acetyltransferase